MSLVIITPACDRDLPQLNQLMYDLHHEHHLACPEHFKTAEEIEQEKSIVRYLDDPECLVYVAKIDSQIVGFISGHFCELISSVSKAVPMGSIDELYVEPQYRQQHIAQQLFQKMEQTLKEYGITQVFVEVWDFNQGAQSFYQRSGFSSHIHWLRKSIDSK
ncbi:GNAT family N-acetyltransferase [Vibrio anguillarum]|uniref:GNAT family N-acetyltransferase n=1 Tax=Vibrio anguillarum TaxID=55601 RepID=UPI002FE46B9A